MCFLIFYKTIGMRTNTIMVRGKRCIFPFSVFMSVICNRVVSCACITSGENTPTSYTDPPKEQTYDVIHTILVPDLQSQEIHPLWHDFLAIQPLWELRIIKVQIPKTMKFIVIMRNLLNLYFLYFCYHYNINHPNCQHNISFFSILLLK